jgi:transposase-like protein
VADTFAAREDVRTVLANLDRLDRGDRVLVLASAFGGDTSRDLARRYGITEGALRQRLARARRRLNDPRRGGLVAPFAVKARVARWLHGRRLDPTPSSAATTALSAAMTGVLIVAVAPSHGVLPPKTTASEAIAAAVVEPRRPGPCPYGLCDSGAAGEPGSDTEPEACDDVARA